MRARLVVTLCRSFNPDAQSILDLGCGGGQLAWAAREQDLTRYVGADLSPFAVETARGNMHCRRKMYPPSCRFETGDVGTYTPVEVACGQRFDLIVFSEVLYYVPTPRDAAAFVRRCADWLNPGGSICVTMKDDGKSRAVLRALSGQFKLVDSLLFQEQAEQPAYRVRLDAKRPAYLIGLWQPRHQRASVHYPLAQCA